MRVYVVDVLSPEALKDPSEIDKLSTAPSINSLTWIPVPRLIDAAQLDFFVTNAAPSVLRSDVVVIGLHPDSAARVHDVPDVLDDVSRRITGSTLIVVHSDHGDLVIKHVGGDRVAGLQESATLECIRRHDVADLLRRPGSELPKHPSIHYMGPNRDHYEAFLRPGFGARSVEELDRLAFWLAPMVRGRECFVVDHWSMIPIAYHVGGYLRHFGNRATIRVASLKAYDENPDVLERRMEIAFEPIKRTAGAALVSVNSSGRLVRDLILPTMRKVGFDDPISIALARTPNPPEHRLPALTVLSKEFNRYVPEDCPACTRGGSTVIPIQHDTYLLTLAAYTKETAITRKHAEKSAQMMKRYGGISAFRVHKTHSDGRHHAYFIDLAPMLELCAFQTRLARTVDPWRGIGIDLIVHPGHRVAARLADMVAKELGGIEVLECDEGELARLPCERKEALLDARRICVVDDVIISGARVFGYRTAINVIRRDRGRTACELYCLVGVARPRNEKALMGVSDIVHHTSADPRFRSVECLFLPNWDESECRWCAELRILDLLPPGIRERGLIRDRLQSLRDRTGLVEGLFLPWTGDEEKVRVEPQGSCMNGENQPTRRFWDLGRGSVFGDVQGVDLAVSVAAAIQRMRGMRRTADGRWEESELDEMFQSPVAKVLDPLFYLGGRYYEPVIIASILRAARGHDVRSPGDDGELRTRVDVVASAECSTELHGELMLSAALKQLPRTSYQISKAHPDLAAVVQEIFGSEAGGNSQTNVRAPTGKELCRGES